MKSSKAEMTAVAAAEQEAKKAVTKAKKVATTTKGVAKVAKKPRKTAAERRLEQKQAGDVWLQVTKVVVPIWFGNCSVKQGLKLSNDFGPAGALALTFVGKDWRDEKAEGTHPFSMEMQLRLHGFDREEARELRLNGFLELRQAKLVKYVKKPTNDASATYTLNAKGQKWFTLLERSAGCAPEGARE